MQTIRYIMCKKCVQALTTISNGMKEYLKEGFENAIVRDMSREMDDEEGMFNLFIYEHIAEQLKNVVDMTLMEAMIQEVGDTLFSTIANPLREVFEQEWA